MGEWINVGTAQEEYVPDVGETKPVSPSTTSKYAPTTEAEAREFLEVAKSKGMITGYYVGGGQVSYTGAPRTVKTYEATFIDPLTGKQRTITGESEAKVRTEAQRQQMQMTGAFLERAKEKGMITGYQVEGGRVSYTPAARAPRPGEPRFVRAMSAYEKAEKRVREATTYKVMPTWREWQKDILKGYGIESRPPKEGEKAGLYVAGQPITKAPIIKESEWAEPRAKELYGFEKGQYTELREKPLKITATTIAAGGIGAVGAAGVLPHVPIISPVIKWGLPAAYAGTVGLRIKTAEGPEARGEEVGRILVGELFPMAVGARLGADVGVAFKRWRAPVFEFRIFEDVAPKQIQFRDVGGKLKPELKLGPSRVYERTGAIRPPTKPIEFIHRVDKTGLKVIEPVKKPTGAKILSASELAARKHTLLESIAGKKLPKGVKKTPWKTAVPKTIYIAPTEVTPPTTATIVSGKQALIQVPKVATKATTITAIKPATKVAPFAAFAPVSVAGLLRQLEFLEPTRAEPMAITFPVEKVEARVAPIEAVTPISTTKTTPITTLRVTDVLKSRIGQVGKTITTQAVVQVPAITQVTGQMPVQTAIQETAVIQIPTQVGITKHITTPITTPKLIHRPPFTPLIGLGLPGGAMKFRAPRIPKGFKVFKFKTDIRPLAGLLSLTITEAKTWRKARHPKATPKIKKMYLKEVREKPWTFEFPTAEMLAEPKTKKKRKKPLLDIGIKGVKI